MWENVVIATYPDFPVSLINPSPFTSIHEKAKTGNRLSLVMLINRG